VSPVLPRLAPVVLAFAVLAATTAVEAAVSPFWQQLGSSSASGNGVSQTPSPKAVFDGALAVGRDGRPVVAYTEYPDANVAQGVITVKRWTGSAWELLSGPAGVGQGYEPQVRVSASGAIYVAWLEDDASGNTEIRLRGRTTSTFEQLGGSDAAGGISGTNTGITVPYSLALTASGNPLVAFLGFARSGVVDVTETPAVIDGTAQVYVRRWTGSAWEFVGSDFAGGGASNAVSFVTAAGGTILHDADSPSLTVDNTGAPVVAFTYFTTIDGAPSGNTDIYVTRWNGATWTAVGPAVPSGESPAGVGGAGGVSNSAGGSLNPALAAGAMGHLALAWEEKAAAGEVHVWVRAWNGVDTWEELGGSATGSGFTAAGTTNMLPSVAIDPSGRPVVAWQALTAPENPTEIFVLRWNGADAWEELGLDSASNAGISNAPLDALAPALALTPTGGTTTAGTPTVAWLDVSASGSAQVFLRQLTLTTHRLTVTVATPAGTTGQGTVGAIGGPTIACAGIGTCSTDVGQGTSVSLVATPQPGNRFLNWSGGPCHGQTTLACRTFNLTANASITALFRGSTGVEVLKAGNGAGTVTGTGVSCGADCLESVFAGTRVTLTATPATGSSFTGWTGDVCNGQASGACVFTATGVSQTVSATFQLKKQRLAVSATGSGFTTSTPAGVNCGSGGHAACGPDYDYGTTVVLTPFPAVDSMLSSWTGCTSLNGSRCTVLMTANRTVVGKFVTAHTLTVTASGNGSGKITSATPPGLTCVGNCSVSRLFPATASVALTPQPAAGTNFRWTGGVCTGAGACTTLMSVNRSAAGQFTLNRYSLTVTNRPSGNVVNVPGGALIDCGNGDNACAATLDYGTPVTLRATANPGFTFVNWTGTVCAGSTNASCFFQLKANTSITPNFRARTLVTVVKGGNGTGTVSGPGISCGADCAENELDGRTVRLTAAPAVGSRFLGFGGACVSNTSTCHFLPVGDSQNVSATFRLIPFTVTVLDRTNGAAISNPLTDRIACGAAAAGGSGDCLATLDFGTQVVLQATPITGSRFVNWTGTVCSGSTNATCAFRIPAANVTVSPNFKDVTRLTLNKTGTGGTVVSAPAGISCGAACTTAAFDFARGILVRLTPTPAVGWSFDGFAGACAGVTCSLNASAPTAIVNAGFSIQHRRLTVTVVGSGAVGGLGVTCNTGRSPCLVDFDYGTSVPLTATASPGHRFTGWSQTCSGVGACTKLMTANHSVTATFKPEFALTVTRTGNAGTSSGTITSSPAGVSCGTNCDEIYLGGTVVTLTRSAPTAGRTFRWGGDCAFRGTNATCALPLNAHASVSADYSLQRLGLSVIKNGGALGSVTGLAGRINCGADCAEVVDYGTPVTLLASPTSNPAAEFVSWTGCATAATNASCSVAMTANRTVMVTFRPLVTSLELRTVSTAPLAVGGVRQVSAVAVFTDGSQQDVTTQATWTSLAPATASVSTTGLVTGRVPGNTSVMASFRLHAGDVPVTDTIPVSVDALQTIQVTCSPFGGVGGLTCLPSGVNFSVHCQALGTFTNAGTDNDITDQVTWSTSNAAVARSTGLVAFNGPIRQSFRMVGPATGAGTAVLRATESGKSSPATGTPGTDPWAVQGVVPTVTALEVTPASSNVAVGDTRQLQARATVTGTVAACASPQRRDFSTAVTWTSTAENRADVSFFGEVTGIAPGSATIRASYGIGNPPPFSDTASITVVP